MVLLFEIGTEELPPGDIDGALEALVKHLQDGCSSARLQIGEVRTFATPRRLALLVEGVAAEAETIEETIMGPAARIAFDAEGRPTKAALGFARGKGLDPESLVRVETEKGEYVAAVVRREGEAASVVISRILSSAFAAIPWKKGMRWGWNAVTFGRPVHWIVAMLDSRVIEVSFADVVAGNTTRGHRFMAPEPVTLPTASQYVEVLRQQKVLADPQERRALIEEGVAKLAAEAGLKAVPDAELVDEVIHLIEWPVPLLGRFPEAMLEVPREVLIESMRSHQRYFATEDESGALANGFVFVSNMVVPDPDVVIKGNLRVLMARLEDAKFFYREDRKTRLDARLDALKAVRYIDGLGSLRDRSERLATLATRIAEILYPGDAQVASHATRAALLSKTDLVTGMVGEFPSLQGTMGRYYATFDGEPAEVAEAIEAHYAPRGAWDAPPESPASIVVALAEKLDAIAGCFALGLIPTGSADPYGLRRSALGVLRTCIDRGLRLPLRAVFSAAVRALPAPETVGSRKKHRPEAEVINDGVDFVEGRLKALLTTDYPTDIADAVVAVIGDEIYTAPERAKVLDRMRRDADFMPLAAAFKRSVNIVTKAIDDDDALAVLLEAPAPDVSLFDAPEEHTLWSAVEAATGRVQSALEAADFEAVGSELIALKGPIDGFFDGPMVNVEDQAVRRNRLTLLANIRALFLRFADIARIQADVR